MLAVYLGLTGLLSFVSGVVVLGLWVRWRPTRKVAEQASRVGHFLFFACLGTPFLVAVVAPGLAGLDAVTGVRPLPWRWLWFAAGLVIALPGLYFFAGSNKALRARGSGANAFRLTLRVVGLDVYEMTRNPMSFGYYLLCLAIGLMSGSTTLTAYVALGIVPAHLFFLKFFEERELSLRFGESYRDYTQRVPFLLPRLSQGGGVQDRSVSA